MVGRIGAAVRPIASRPPRACGGDPVGAGLPAMRPVLARQKSDVTLFGLATRQPATVALLRQARGPGGFDAEATAAGRLLGNYGRLGGRLAGWRGADELRRRLGRSHNLSRCCSRLGGLAQFGQRRRLVLGGRSLRFDQRTLARLAGYVLGHGSADKGLTAAPAGGIEAIGGKVSNQNRTSPMRCHLKRPAFSHRKQGLAEPPGSTTTIGTSKHGWHFAIMTGMLAGFRCPAL